MEFPLRRDGYAKWKEEEEWGGEGRKGGGRGGGEGRGGGGDGGEECESEEKRVSQRRKAAGLANSEPGEQLEKLKPLTR